MNGVEGDDDEALCFSGSSEEDLDLDPFISLNQSSLNDAAVSSIFAHSASRCGDDEDESSHAAVTVDHSATPVNSHQAVPNASAAAAGVLVLDDTKAGMQTIDKTAIERIINETSAGSKFYGNEQRKDVARQARLAKTQFKLAEFDAGKVSRLPHERRCAELIHNAKTQTPLGNFIHFDMDAFYAAVEELLHPELKSVPFGVGGMGMLCTSNYLARAFGVRAGMPGYIAKKLCPQLQFAWSGFEHYSKYSDMFKSIVREYDPHFTSMGMDELTMNATPFLAAQRRRFAADPDYEAMVSAELLTTKTVATVQAWRNADTLNENLPASAAESKVVTVEQLAWEIRARVYAVTELTASAGIAPTPALAKVFSNFEKPDGQAILRARTVDDLQTFMATQPIRRIAGVGRVLEQLMQGIGITTCQQVYEQRVRLSYAMTPKMFEFLLVSSIGCQSAFGGFGGATEDGEEGSTATAAPNKFAGATKRKSVGKERTFGPMQSIAAFLDKASSIFEKAYEAFLEENVLCKQVGIKLKRRTFDVHQTTVNLAEYTKDKDTLWAAFESLLEPVAANYSDFRLLGCRFVDLTTEEELAASKALAEAKHGPVRHQLTLDALLAKPQRNAKKHRTERGNALTAGHVTVIDGDSDEDDAVVATELADLSGDSAVEILSPPKADKKPQCFVID